MFDWENRIWSDTGIVTLTGTEGDLGTRDSFPARRAATRVMRELMGLKGDPID